MCLKTETKWWTNNNNKISHQEKKKQMLHFEGKTFVINCQKNSSSIFLMLVAVFPLFRLLSLSAFIFGKLRYPISSLPLISHLMRMNLLYLLWLILNQCACACVCLRVCSFFRWLCIQTLFFPMWLNCFPRTQTHTRLLTIVLGNFQQIKVDWLFTHFSMDSFSAFFVRILFRCVWLMNVYVFGKKAWRSNLL